MGWFGEAVAAEVEFLKYSVPLTVLKAAQLAVVFITIAFAGSIGVSVLAGVGLANTLYNIIVYGIKIGYVSTMDTFGTAVFGSTNKNLLSDVLLKCILQGGIVYLYCQGVVMNSVYVFSLIPHTSTSSQDVVMSAMKFVRLTFVNGFLDLILAAGKKYYCIQKKGNIVLFSSLVLAGVHFLLCLLFVTKLQYGVYGLALALTLSKTCDILVLVSYFFVYKDSLSWTPVNRTVFHKWHEMVKLGLYGSFNVTAELLIYEAAAIASQFMGTEATATWVITFQLCSLTFALSSGIVSAETIFVGKYLGVGNITEIKKWIAVGLVNSLLNSVSNALVLYLFIGYLGGIFTDDAVVIATLCQWFWIMSLKTVLDHTASYLTRGVLVAMGKQRNISIIIFVLGYGVVVPLIIILSLFSDLGVLCLFISIAVYTFLFLVSSLIYMSRVNLDKEIYASQRRLNANTTEPINDLKSVNSESSGSGDETDTLLSNQSRSIWLDPGFRNFVRHLFLGFIFCFLFTIISFIGDFCT